MELGSFYAASVARSNARAQSHGCFVGALLPQLFVGSQQAVHCRSCYRKSCPVDLERHGGAGDLMELGSLYAEPVAESFGFTSHTQPMFDVYQKQRVQGYSQTPEM